jgi:glutamate dehydrogenase
MGGDVFGNGMLRSPKTKLLAAFNHLHIFVDPNPSDCEASFTERQRLFDLPRSAWTDYDEKLISKGGGVFSRSAKRLTISNEMKAAFDIEESTLSPTELITALLKAPVDLIWNGGIGTYVKSSVESHADVGDKANDSLRIDGRDLRCKVIGEGGNLGFTQLARIEFSLHGGRCLTDFIDNAGGVDCSDHEVNFKILLDGLVAEGDLTNKQRNQWLLNMTDEVAGQVLTNNYRQTQAISIANSENCQKIEQYRRHINALEAAGKLDRALEFIPVDEEIAERKAADGGLTGPELSVLMCYTKADLKEQLIRNAVDDDAYLAREAMTAFPQPVVESFSQQINQHRLRREIVATQVANDLCNTMGINFLHNVMESTGASVLDVTKAYVAARDIFQLPKLWRKIEALDHKISAELQIQMMRSSGRTVRMAARWLLKNYRMGINTQELVERYQQPVQQILGAALALQVGRMKLANDEQVQSYIEGDVPLDLASQIVSMDIAYHALNIISIAQKLNAEELWVAKAFFTLGERLTLNQFASKLNTLPSASHWHTLARETLRDDLEWQQRRITQGVLSEAKASDDLEIVLATWVDRNQVLIERWYRMVKEILAADESDFPMYSVAIRELLDLSQATLADS